MCMRHVPTLWEYVDLGIGGSYMVAVACSRLCSVAIAHGHTSHALYLVHFMSFAFCNVEDLAEERTRLGEWQRAA